MQTLFRTTALLGFAAASMQAQSVVGRSESSWSTRERLSSGQTLRLASPNGPITITQGSGAEVVIRAEKRADRDARMEDMGFVVKRTGTGMIVCAVFESADECDSQRGFRSNSTREWNRSRPSARFTVQIPAGVLVNASTGNGDISITGAGSEANASTGNGSVLVSGTTGSVTASTGNGKVIVEDARGPVKASTGNGDVRVSTSFGPVDVSSGNGDIDVWMGRLERSAGMRFTTGSGRIVVALPADFNADIVGSTGSGDISSELPLRVQGRRDSHRLRGTIGTGGERLTMTTGSGDIVLRRARDR